MILVCGIFKNILFKTLERLEGSREFQHVFLFIIFYFKSPYPARLVRRKSFF